MSTENTESRKIIVTGASGFLGKNLIRRLAQEENLCVYALSSRPQELSKKNPLERVRFLHKDILFGESGEEILRDACLVNCAFPRNATGTGMADGLKYIHTLFTAAGQYGAQALINISSQSVYSGKREAPAGEVDPADLQTPYAVGKYCTELMLDMACRDRGICCTNIRLASLIGPGFDQRIVNRFVRQGLETGRLSVKKNSQLFGFFDILDAVSALSLMLAGEWKGWERVYNLGGTGAYTLIEIAETVRRVLLETAGKEVTIEVTEGDERGSSALDCGLFYRTFGFTPQTTLEQSVRNIAAAIL